MSYLLFIDESGQDRRESPYEVLAGIAIRDKHIWPLVQCIGALQEECFGVQRYKEYRDEAKGMKILKKKTFAHAATYPPIAEPDRMYLARAMLADGTRPAPMKLAALAQAKIAYVRKVFEQCAAFDCQAFASIIPQDAARTDGKDFLRKDYAYLFERFHHMLWHTPGRPAGIVVFDELDKSRSQLLVNQMEGYFLKTYNGQQRSKTIVPEPLFVHSDLTTMIQVADLAAYIIAWGVRLNGMREPARPELQDLAECVLRLRYHQKTPSGHDKWGFKVINDLRARQWYKKEEGNAACAAKPPQTT